MARLVEKLGTNVTLLERRMREPLGSHSQSKPPRESPKQKLQKNTIYWNFMPIYDFFDSYKFLHRILHQNLDGVIHTLYYHMMHLCQDKPYI